MNDILKELINKYKSSEFCIKIDKYFNVILFDDEKLKNDEEFIEYAYSLADKYLNEEDNLKFTLSFDYLGCIENEKCKATEKDKSRIETIDLDKIEKTLNNERDSLNIKLEFEFREFNKLNKTERMKIMNISTLVYPKYSLINNIKGKFKKKFRSLVNPYLAITQLSNFSYCKIDENIIKN